MTGAEPQLSPASGQPRNDAPPLAPAPASGSAPDPALLPQSAHGQPDLPAVAAALQQRLGDRFEVLEPIAIGGMATLVQLRHRTLGGLFVAKVLHASFLAEPAIRAAFRREARHVAQVAGHPAAVPVFEFIEDDAFACMLMPFVAGEDLDHLLARHGRFSRDEALMLTAQLSSLLMFAESLGIFHCDLAPANIRLDPFGQYRLFDFGLSRGERDSPEEGLFTAGTPAYNSPERIRGERPGIRGDLYALGLILVEVLSGHPAVQAETLEELAAKHLAGDWQMPPEIESDAALALLVRRLTAVDPGARMGSAFELAGAIAAFGYELPSFARALGTSPTAPPKPRRRRLQADGDQA